LEEEKLGAEVEVPAQAVNSIEMQVNAFNQDYVVGETPAVEAQLNVASSR
jgi:hypothetical protein